MPRVLVIHGAGMNMRGKVQTEIFGPMTLPEYDERIGGYAAELGLEGEIFHSHLEGEIVNKLYEANDRGFDAAIFNPAAFGSGYPALVAAISQVGFPTIEVHISNPIRRGPASETARVSRGIFAPAVDVVKRDAAALSELSAADCAEADGLMIMGFGVTGADLARFPKLRAIVRMGVGYDKLDRPAAADRNMLICNVPDYGTTEVADHAIALALTLRRGILLHHELQRKDPPAPFRSFQHPLIQRLGTQTFGILGLGRIRTAGAVRAQ